MNRPTKEQCLQIIEFYYQNACFVKKDHSALLPFYVYFNDPLPRDDIQFFFPKCNNNLHDMWFQQDGDTQHL